MRRSIAGRIAAVTGSALLSAGLLLVPALPAQAACTAPGWQPETVYTGGETVSYEQHEWEARWWTKGKEPGSSESGPWTDLGACDSGGDPPGDGEDPPGDGQDPPDEPLPDRVKAGYYMQWSTYGRDYQVKDLVTSGSAERLTHLNYAFIKVSSNNRCVSGDPYADYVKSFGSADSVDGVGDTWDQQLRGNFNQLRELKERNPDLEILASIGGWTWSQYFSNAALNPQARENFVKSCISMILEGNLPERSNAGGPGAAAGVFDGIDIDWEWPAATGHPHNIVRPEDRENFVALLEEFREQMNALGQQTGEDYSLTAFLPADETKVEKGIMVDRVFELLDFGNLQGYDFHGTWESTTNHQSQLYSPPDDGAPEGRQFSVHKTVNTYLERGAPASKITFGVPFYGRGWEGVPGGGTSGLYQPASGPAPGEFPSVDGNGSYHWLLDQNLTVHYDPEAVAAWGYNGDEFWSFDTPRVLEEKIAYIEERDLLGVMIWPMSGDTADGTLMRTIDANLG